LRISLAAVEEPNSGWLNGEQDVGSYDTYLVDNFCFARDSYRIQNTEYRIQRRQQNSKLAGYEFGVQASACLVPPEGGTLNSLGMSLEFKL
jgi:hypothetical protein